MIPLTGKEKAWVAGAIGLILGLVNVILPFITNGSVLHYINIGVAVLGFISLSLGVFVTTNKPIPAIPDAPAPVFPAGTILVPQSVAVAVTPAPAAVEAPVAPTAPPVA